MQGTNVTNHLTKLKENSARGYNVGNNQKELAENSTQGTNVPKSQTELRKQRASDSDFPTALDDLLPPERTMDTLRKRRHNYILPLVRTERFKRTFINRCLFSY